MNQSFNQMFIRLPGVNEGSYKHCQCCAYTYIQTGAETYTVQSLPPKTLWPAQEAMAGVGH